jgi:hypothetical protein
MSLVMCLYICRAYFSAKKKKQWGSINRENGRESHLSLLTSKNPISWKTLNMQDLYFSAKKKTVWGSINRENGREMKLF